MRFAVPLRFHYDVTDPDNTVLSEGITEVLEQFVSFAVKRTEGL